MKELRETIGKSENGIIQSQIIMLNDLSVKLYKETDPQKKEVIRKDLEILSLATNSIKEIDKQKVIK